ncbi:MAG: hypothetical protein Q9184_001974 [Pyrenodesmia sp. 2 TL-2023]
MLRFNPQTILGARSLPIPRRPRPSPRRDIPLIHLAQRHGDDPIIAVDFVTVYYSSKDTEATVSGLEIFGSEIFKAVEADMTSQHYLDNYAASGNLYSDEACFAVDKIFGFFKISAGESMTKASKSSYTDGAPKDPLKEIGSVFHVYDLVFVYFFIAAGFTLLTMTILIALTKKNKSAGDYAAIALRAIVGLALTLVAAVERNYTAQEHFLFSI